MKLKSKAESNGSTATPIFQTPEERMAFIQTLSGDLLREITRHFRDFFEEANFLKEIENMYKKSRKDLLFENIEKKFSEITQFENLLKLQEFLKDSQKTFSREVLKFA